MKRIVAAVIIAIAVIGGGLWWYYGLARTSPAGSGISASGFIEATDVSVASDVAGRIVEIAADEGDQAVERAAFQVMKAQRRGDQAGDGALAGGRRSVDGDDRHRDHDAIAASRSK